MTTRSELLENTGRGTCVRHRPVPETLARRCGIATLIATLVLLIAVLSAEPLGIDQEAFSGGWQAPALIAAMVEGVLIVAGPIWVLAVAQRA